MKTTEDIATAIRERAYHIWGNAGRPVGRADEHWFQAAQEIFVSQPPLTPKKPKTKAIARKAGAAPSKKATATQKISAKKKAAPKKKAAAARVGS
jgi:hypothetical protein